MLSLFAQSELSDLMEKVEKGERLDFEAGVRMMDSRDILALGYMANLVRERKNGNQTYFIVNRHLNHTNDLQASTSSLEEIATMAGDARTEVFSPSWLESQEAAHRLGMRTNATMLYGHMETTEQQVDQLLQLRALQDRTGGFQTFSPLPVCSKDIKLEGTMGVENTTGFEDLKMLAISRILLDNFDHIKAFWIMLGPKLAQVSLAFGVDDLETSQTMSKRALIHMINKAGRDAVERDTDYRVHKTD